MKLEQKSSCPLEEEIKRAGGYVIGFSETADYDADKIKFILRRAEDKRVIESKLVALAAWMKRGLRRNDDPSASNGTSDQEAGEDQEEANCPVITF